MYGCMGVRVCGCTGVRVCECASVCVYGGQRAGDHLPVKRLLQREEVGLLPHAHPADALEAAANLLVATEGRHRERLAHAAHPARRGGVRPDTARGGGSRRHRRRGRGRRALRQLPERNAESAMCVHVYEYE